MEERAAITIQALYRGHTARAYFRTMVARREHNAAASIQGAYRGHLVRTTLRRAHNAAVILQANWMKHSAQTSLRKHHRAAVRIQGCVPPSGGGRQSGWACMRRSKDQEKIREERRSPDDTHHQASQTKHAKAAPEFWVHRALGP